MVHQDNGSLIWNRVKKTLNYYQYTQDNFPLHKGHKSIKEQFDGKHAINWEPDNAKSPLELQILKSIKYFLNPYKNWSRSK